MRDLFRIMNSRAGNAMTTSLMVTGAAAAISAFLFSQSLSTDQAAKIPRIKSAMNQVEISLRAMILQPGTFTCTQAGATADANCKINLAFLNSLERELPGSDGGSGAHHCKVAIQDAGIGSAGNTTVNGSPFVATLRYVCASDSSASKIAAQKISVDIPGEVTTVSADTFTCADIDINKPILVGFNSSSGGGMGGIKCAALKNATCPANHFVSGIDYKTMKVTCSPISSTAVAAPSTEMLGGLTWTGDSFTQTSLTRKNPSAYPPVGPMFTMTSIKNTTLVGRPADVPGGSCVCDAPLTTCWNGDQVCIPAGEACTPAPVSPAPSVVASVAPSTAPSVAASVAPSTAPSVTASVALVASPSPGGCRWSFDGPTFVPDKTALCIGGRTPKPTAICDASMDGQTDNPCLDAGKGYCRNGFCSDGFLWTCSCGNPVVLPNPSPSAPPRVSKSCGSGETFFKNAGVVSNINAFCAANLVGSTSGYQLDFYYNNSDVGTNSNGGNNPSTTEICCSNPVTKYGCADLTLPGGACYQQAILDCIPGGDINKQVSQIGCLDGKDTATNINGPSRCGATTPCWATWDCKASASGGIVSCSSGSMPVQQKTSCAPGFVAPTCSASNGLSTSWTCPAGYAPDSNEKLDVQPCRNGQLTGQPLSVSTSCCAPKPAAWTSIGKVCEYCNGTSYIPYNICPDPVAGAACTISGVPTKDTCKKNIGTQGAGTLYEIFKCQ